MSIPIETIIGWIGTGILFVGYAFVANYRLNEAISEIRDLWSWKNGHEKEAAILREKFQLQIAELKGAHLVVNEQFKQIMAILTEIKQRMTELENKE